MSGSPHRHPHGYSGSLSPTSNPEIETPRINPTSSITSSLFNSPIDPLSAETSPSLLATNVGPGLVAPPHHHQQQQLLLPVSWLGLPKPRSSDLSTPNNDPTLTASARPGSGPTDVQRLQQPRHDGQCVPVLRISMRRDTLMPSRHHQVSQQQQQHDDDDRDDDEEDTGSGEILVISGGSGYNDLVSATPGATYVMPISDNGGSSSEIIRVLGGPSIGDLRSRLNRLIPIPSRPHPTPFPYPEGYVPPPSNTALHALLSYRLPSTGSSRAIKQEWHDILEGRHPLWHGIEADRKEVIRGFLVHFESEVLRRAHRNFDFRGASISNFFLAAAQKFFRSIQSAIFLFSATTQINAAQSGSKVVPVINTNHTATIAAQLEDGEVVVGQCEISHPAAPASGSRTSGSVGRATRVPGSTGTTKASTLEPGTPSSAVFDTFKRRAPVDIQDALTRNMARCHLKESFSAADLESAHEELGQPSQQDHEDHQLGTSYDSMSSSLVHPPAPSSSTETTGAISRGPSSTPHTPALSFRDRGRTTVGNTGDGLDPEDEDDDDDDNDGGQAHGGGGARDEEEDGIGSSGNIVFRKSETEGDDEVPLSSRIERIFYVNAYRNEIYPAPNPTFLSSLSRSRTLIYSCGSIWTSLVPCLSLRGVATHIATSRSLRYKVLLLNTVQDRETRGLNAEDFVRAITTSLFHSDVPGQTARWRVNELITHLVYFEQGEIEVNVESLQRHGITCLEISPTSWTKSGRPKFDEEAIRVALERITMR